MGLKIIHNVLAKGGLTIFNLILPLVVMPYIYRVLDPHDLGMIEYATAIVTYFQYLECWEYIIMAYVK